MLCAVIRIALKVILMSTQTYFYFGENRKNDHIMLLDLGLKSTLIGSNYSSLKQFFIVPEVFESNI